MSKHLWQSCVEIEDYFVVYFWSHCCVQSAVSLNGRGSYTLVDLLAIHASTKHVWAPSLKVGYGASNTAMRSKYPTEWSSISKQDCHICFSYNNLPIENTPSMKQVSLRIDIDVVKSYPLSKTCFDLYHAGSCRWIRPAISTMQRYETNSMNQVCVNKLGEHGFGWSWLCENRHSNLNHTPQHSQTQDLSGVALTTTRNLT